MSARSCRAFARRRGPKHAGCALAFAGVALVFAGVIGAGWLAIILTLYALRRLAAPRTRPAQRRARDGLGDKAGPGNPAGPRADATLERLDSLVAQARPHLPEELVVHLYSVRCSIAQALPWLLEGPAHDADLYTVRETVRRYLPDTLAPYLALPPALRTAHPVKDGKTPRQLLAQQLALLDEAMREIASKAGSRDVQSLLANGRFLEARFGRPDLVSG